MRVHGLPALFALIYGTTLCAQPSLPTEGCFIRYQYDAAGNRVQRDWICVTGGGSGFKSNAADTAIGQGSLQEVHMNLAPNPASGNMRVTMTEDVGVGQAIVHDAQGNVVIQTQVQGGTFLIDVASLSNGPYYLSFLRGAERIVTGFSVQH